MRAEAVVMSEVVRDANVYYLPAHPVERIPVTARWATLHARLARAWWRLRLTLIDIRLAIRRPGGRLFADEGPIFDRAAELVERTRPRPTHPARIIDFATARVRLRPVAEA
ncbi:MAG TPA: hypothetical protein VGU22_09890 [Methylomirabilota bacterium]|jgi:hypothetical protein|nr:hypothetical protein [Methylomirabilota bacterium]